jgi:hypothetical protein
MDLKTWFWAIYVLSVLFGGWSYYDGTAVGYRRFGGYFILWLLVGILGYHVFGSAVRG